MQYGAVLDVAEWFNDFVSVAEGSDSGVPAAAPHRKGRRRLSLGAPRPNDPDTAGTADKPVDAPGKQRGRKRKAVVGRDADSSSAGEDAAAGAGVNQQSAADCSGVQRGRRVSATKASQHDRVAREAAAAGRAGAVRWADDGSTAADSDARESEGNSRICTAFVACHVGIAWPLPTSDAGCPPDFSASIYQHGLAGISM